MSLINDALKRASQAQPANTPTLEAETPMQPAEPRRPVGLPIYFVPVLLFVVSGACWFLVKGWDARRQAGLYPEPIIVQAREIQAGQHTAVAEGTVAVPLNRQFALNERTAVEASAASHTSTSARPSASTASEDAPKPVAFKLQGIFYRPAKPSAVINSKTVYVGDLIANAKVKAIDHQSVTIEYEGQTKVLTMQ